MLYPLWSAKGGSGCTAVAVALAAQLAQRNAGGALLVDLGGDLPAATGIAEPAAGLTDWMAAPHATDESLARLEVPVAGGVDLLPLGAAWEWGPDRGLAAHRLLAGDRRSVVVDVSVVGRESGVALADLRELFAGDEGSLLVTRACYLAMRRAVALPIRPSGVVLVREVGRSLDRHDVSDIIGVPVVAEIDTDPIVARAVDAGRLALHCPRPFARQVRGLVR